MEKNQVCFDTQLHQPPDNIVIAPKESRIKTLKIPVIPRRSAIVVIKVLAGQETGVHGNPLIRKDRRVLQAEIVMFWHEAKPHFIEISLFQFLKSLLDDLGFLKGK